MTAWTGSATAGKGESVWLGWFLYSTLMRFADFAERQRTAGRAARNGGSDAAALKQALEREAWDGDWYRRAYFDDGTPLGSVANSECRIDSIAQSWAVISGAAEPARAARAMAAVDKYLVRRDDQLSLLFTPPFDNPAHDPGYIKGYPPGIRENGGQYTHGAVWAALALRHAGRRRQGGRIVVDAQSDQSRRQPRRRPPLQGRALCRLRRSLFRCRRMSGAAAGPGTPARRAGCTA